MSSAHGKVVKLKPSYVPYVWKGIFLIVFGLALFVSTSALELPFLLSFGPILTIAGIGIAALGFVVTLAGAVRRGMYSYQITDTDLVIQKQFLRRSVRRIPFVALSDVQASQSLIARLAGYGNLTPISKSGYGLVRGMERSENIVAEMVNVPNPDKIANIIMSRASLTVSAA